MLDDRFDYFTSEALESAALDANTAVHDRASEHAELRGMGTTLCALALVDTADGSQALSIINVGDSRCYRWRDGTMTQITRDHSLVEDMRAAGQITDDEASAMLDDMIRENPETQPELADLINETNKKRRASREKAK